MHHLVAIALLLLAAGAAAFDPLAFAIAPGRDHLREGTPVADTATIPTEGIYHTCGANFGDFTLLLGYTGFVAHMPGDLSTVFATAEVGATHMVPHPDGDLVVVDTNDDTVLKYSSTGTALVEVATDSNSGDCNDPALAVIQRTGNERVFVMCPASSAVCQYDSDLSGRTCTSTTTSDLRGLGLAPDDSFIVVRDQDILRKFTINDGAGTLSVGATLDISGSTTSIVATLAVLSDDRIVIPDGDNDEVEVVNAAFSSVSTISVNSGSFGGITPGCDEPQAVAVDPAGTGDVFVACDASDSLLIISNDMATTAYEVAAPSDLEFCEESFAFTIAAESPLINFADAAGTKMYVGGSQSTGPFQLDLTGAGTPGLAGSYAVPVMSFRCSLSGAYAMGNYDIIELDTVVGGVVLGDGTLAIAVHELDYIVRLSSDYGTVLDTVFGFIQIAQMIPHPDGELVVLDYGTATMYKYETSGNDLLQADSESGTCNGPVRAVVQQTGNQRIFVMCALASPNQVCQFDADLSSPACTTLSSTSARGLGIAPDDSFLVVRDDDTLRKYTINDGSGTLTTGPTFTIPGGTGASVYSLVVLSDYRVVYPILASDEIEVVNAAMNAVDATIAVNSGTLGGITPGCEGPVEVASDPAGTGDVFVLCLTSDTVLVLSNDLATTAYEPSVEFFGGTLSLTATSGLIESTLSVSNAAGTIMFVGGEKDIMLFDLTGGGTAGLAGSYAAPLWATKDQTLNGVALGVTARYPTTTIPVGVVDFGDGTMAVGMNGPIKKVLLTSTDYETLYDVSAQLDNVAQLVAHPDGSAIAIDKNTDTIYKFTSTGTALVESASDSNNLECNNPNRVVIQQTGNQRIFVQCVGPPDAFCQYDADLSNRDCTATTTVDPRGIGIAPDDSFLVIRDEYVLRKYTINDGAGTVSAGATLDISAYVGSAGQQSLVVLSDYRIVFSDKDNDEIEVVDAPFTGVTSISVNTGDRTCVGPKDTMTDPTGLGDIMVACTVSNTFIVVSNDVATFTSIGPADLGMTSDWIVSSSNTQTPVGFLPSGELFYGDERFIRITGTPPVGAGGDPIVTDLAGHRFVVGTESRARYTLLESLDGLDTIEFVTSDVRGLHNDYFIDTITVTRAGCGSVTVRALARWLGSEMVGETSACMKARLLHGDNGLVAAAIGDGSAAVVAIPHHQALKMFSFLNVKIAGDVAGLRRAGWKGILGDEAHLL